MSLVPFGSIMVDETQDDPLDLSMDTYLVQEENKKNPEEDQKTNQDELAAAHVSFRAQAEKQLALYNQVNSCKEFLEKSLGGSSKEAPAKFILGSPDCPSCNDAQFYYIEKKVDELQKSIVERQDIIHSTPTPNILKFDPAVFGPRNLEERLYHRYKAHPYMKQPPIYKNCYAQETRRSETIKIFDLGTVDDNKQKSPDDLTENLVKNLSEIKLETHSDFRFLSAIKENNLVPQLHGNPMPMTSTHVELGAYDVVNRHGMHSRYDAVPDLNSRYVEEQKCWQPVRMDFNTSEIEDLLKEIQTIEAYVAVMDRNANQEAIGIERHSPEYWAFLTNKLTKIKTERYLINGFNDVYCSRTLSRVRALGKIPKEFWYPIVRPLIIAGRNRFTPQEEGKPKIVLKLSRNLKERSTDRRRYNRQRKRTSEESWSVMQSNISGQQQGPVQATEISTANQEKSPQEKI